MLRDLTQLGATLIGEDRSPFGHTLIVSVPPGSLVAVAQLPLAHEIEAYTPRRVMNDLTRVRMGVSTNTLIGTSDYLNLSGLNVTVNINDTGVDSNHPDFAPPGRLLGDGNPNSLIDYDGHGTHVAWHYCGEWSKSPPSGLPFPAPSPMRVFGARPPTPPSLCKPWIWWLVHSCPTLFCRRTLR